MSGLYNRVPLVDFESEEEEDEDVHFDIPQTWEDFVNVEQVNENSFNDDVKDFVYSFEFNECEEAVATRDSPLFEGSNFNIIDVGRFIQQLKSSNPRIGDRLIASIIGSFAAFLPAGNGIASLLKPPPSMYQVLKVFQNSTGIVDDMRTYSIHTCRQGCRPFWSDKAYLHACPDCGGLR
jgi:hypothetical protein